MAYIGNLPAAAPVTEAQLPVQNRREIGELKQFAKGTLPTGWLECDGAAVSRTTYASLFAAIGTTFGVGDGSTTFNLPDARNRATVGRGQGDTAEGGGTGTARALGDKIGAETHTLAEAEIPAHNHGSGTFRAVMDSSSQSGIVTYGGVHSSAIYTSGSAGVSRTFSVATANTGNDNAHPNESPGLVLVIAIYSGVLS